MDKLRVIGKCGAGGVAAVLVLLGVLAGRAGGVSTGTGTDRVEVSLQSDSRWEKTLNLRRGEVREISVAVSNPSSLPPNGRVAVNWRLENRDGSKGADVSKEAAGSGRDGRESDAFGIYTRPTAHWRKVLHALDPDVFLIYRAPVSGRYVLSLAPVIDEDPVFGGPRWRETGTAPRVDVFPVILPGLPGHGFPCLPGSGPWISRSRPTFISTLNRNPTIRPSRLSPFRFPTARVYSGFW